MEAKDVIEAIEKQRNAALTECVQLYAQLQDEKRKSAALEKQLADAQTRETEYR